MITISDSRYFIDPETLERVWVSRDYKLIRVAKHPLTDELMVVPRHQYTAKVALTPPDNSSAPAVEQQPVSEMTVPTVLMLIHNSFDRRTHKTQTQTQTQTQNPKSNALNRKV